MGASIIGGDTVDHGLWVAFWLFWPSWNLILAAINLLPPFDGGHIAVAVFGEDPQHGPVGSRRGGRTGELLKPAGDPWFWFLSSRMLLTGSPPTWSTRLGFSSR